MCNMMGFHQKSQVGRSSGTREPVPGYPEVATNTPEWFWQSCIVFLVSFMDQFQLSWEYWYHIYVKNSKTWTFRMFRISGTGRSPGPDINICGQSTGKYLSNATRSILIGWNLPEIQVVKVGVSKRPFFGCSRFPVATVTKSGFPGRFRKGDVLSFHLWPKEPESVKNWIFDDFLKFGVEKDPNTFKVTFFMDAPLGVVQGLFVLWNVYLYYKFNVRKFQGFSMYIAKVMANLIFKKAEKDPNTVGRLNKRRN